MLFSLYTVYSNDFLLQHCQHRLFYVNNIDLTKLLKYNFVFVALHAKLNNMLTCKKKRRHEKYLIYREITTRYHTLPYATTCYHALNT